MKKIYIKLPFKELTVEEQKKIDELMEKYSSLDEETLKAMDENEVKENNEPVEVEIIDFTKKHSK